MNPKKRRHSRLFFLKNFQPPPHFALTFMPLSCKIFTVVKAYNFTEGGDSREKPDLPHDHAVRFLRRHARELFDLYYNEDLSLAEIAENCGISRQGVRDVIVRAEAAMNELEDKTGLLKRFMRMQDSVDAIVAAANEIKTINYRQYENHRLEELADSIIAGAGVLKE